MNRSDLIVEVETTVLRALAASDDDCGARVLSIYVDTAEPVSLSGLPVESLSFEPDIRMVQVRAAAFHLARWALDRRDDLH